VKVELERAKCTGIGICESFAPDIFEVNDDGDLVIHYAALAECDEADLERAVDGCPTQALRLVRNE
jgi:ferredoxin